jgi:hypothetical protein
MSSGQMMLPAGESVGRERAVAFAEEESFAEEEPLDAIPGMEFDPLFDAGEEDGGDVAVAEAVVELAMTFVPRSDTSATDTAARATTRWRAGTSNAAGESSTSAPAASMLVVTSPTRSIVSQPFRM